MIREILEQNGINPIIEKTRVPDLYYIRVEKGMELLARVYSYSETDYPIALEQACRQYVRENGFKLEWFNNVVKGTLQYMMGIDLFALLCENISEKDNKLIAWLYANNIEIKE